MCLEDCEAIMARFMAGLNRDIQDKLEMQHYVDLEEMLHKAILVKQQPKRRGPSKQTYGGSSSQPFYQKDDKVFTKPKYESRPSPPVQDKKGKAEVTTTRNRDVKCFKCHGRGNYTNECSNKKAMIL